MKIVITSETPILDDRMGRLEQGQVIDIVDHKAEFYIEAGCAELFETKVAREFPCEAAGAEQPQSASQVALVLPEQTAKPSVSGDKKRKRGA